MPEHQCTCPNPLATSLGICALCSGRIRRQDHHPDIARFDEAVAEHEAAEDMQPDLPTDIAITTSFTPEGFKAWVASDGDLFLVTLPARKSFVLKVPTEHNAFFVAMMQQIRLAMGPEVQAVRMNVVTGPPADYTADEAPAWAQPPNGAQHTEHVHVDVTPDPDTGITPEVCIAHRDENCVTCDNDNDDLWAHPRDLPDIPNRPTAVAAHIADSITASSRPGATPGVDNPMRRAMDNIAASMKIGDTITKPERCTGSGQPGTNVRGQHRGQQRGTCPECGRTFTLRYDGDVPNHKPRR